MKKFGRNIAISVLSILFTLVLLEFAARALHFGSGGFWEPHELYGWRNIPNASGWESCYGECAIHIQINNKGIRDNEIPYEKPPGERRVLFLGDSMTAGFQVRLEDTFEELLEASLNEQTSRSWEMVNGAVNGYGTDNEMIFYEMEGSKYQADVVVLGVYLANDVFNNSRELEMSMGGQNHKAYYELAEDGTLEIKNYPVPDTDTFSIRVGTFLKKYFQLPRFVAQTLALRRGVPEFLRPVVQLFSGGRGGGNEQNDEESQENEEATAVEPTAAPTICDAEYSPEIEYAWSITEALILQLRTEVEANGAELVVLMIPASPQIIPPDDGVSWYCQRPNDELSSFLEEEKIIYLDLLPAFREHVLAGGAPLYFERDFHMNEMGHELAADELVPLFAEQFAGENP